MLVHLPTLGGHSMLTRVSDYVRITFSSNFQISEAEMSKHRLIRILNSFPISRFQISRFHIPDPRTHHQFPVSRFQIPDPSCSFQFPISSFQFPISNFQFPISSFQFPDPRSRNPPPVSSFQFPVSRLALREGAWDGETVS